jgi:hypothetical protein
MCQSIFIIHKVIIIYLKIGKDFIMRRLPVPLLPNEEAHTSAVISVSHMTIGPLTRLRMLRPGS